MGLRDRLFGSKTEAPDPLADLVLAKLKVGYLLDYDMQTWQVTGYARYTFSGQDDAVEEWELTAADQQRYLELADGAWSLSRKIAIDDISGDVRKHILDHDDPPKQVVFEGTEFRLDASYAGQMVANGSGPGADVIRWEFVDGAETTFVGIEQWGETEFSAAAGFVVEDYQFSHILPGQV
jgi:hypothetical protein